NRREFPEDLLRGVEINQKTLSPTERSEVGVIPRSLLRGEFILCRLVFISGSNLSRLGGKI
ncbi:MAG: hypothetical protein U9P14_05250, partial [Gemmatimonadota bacterium]|nr:hypothetical protein [Gemmatimonadota bacterium]